MRVRLDFPTALVYCTFSYLLWFLSPPLLRAAVRVGSLVPRLLLLHLMLRVCLCCRLSFMLVVHTAAAVLTPYVRVLSYSWGPSIVGLCARRFHPHYSGRPHYINITYLNSAHTRTIGISQEPPIVRVLLLFSHINSHNQVRGHRTGSSHSGAEEYPREKHTQPKVVHAYITADAIHASPRNI